MHTSRMSRFLNIEKQSAVLYVQYFWKQPKKKIVNSPNSNEIIYI